MSDVLSGAAWDALNVQTADSNPDMIVGQITLHNELIVFCEQSGEAFYDSGTYPAPFVRNVSGIFEVGCIAPYSIAKIDNSAMWLGRSNTGQGVIYRLNGYTPVRLSTYAIEYAIQTMATISDAQAFTYQQEGHHFYVITFPTGGRTFAFDINTGLWHERAGWNGSVFSRWAAKEYAYFDGKHLVCDYASGNIYSLDLGVYTDGANPKKWVRSWRAPASEMKRVIHNKLTLEAEVGVGQGTLSQTGVVNSINMDNYGSSGAPTMLWHLNTITSSSFRDVIHNGTIFLAVGGTNTCATSLDGVTWTFQTFPSILPQSAAWNGSLFVVSGNSTTYATSPDGVTWTTHTFSFVASAYIASICYGNGIFVANGVVGGGNGEIYTSTNGTTWSKVADVSGYTDASHNIVWNGTIFCGVFRGFGAGTLAYTSPDGATWTLRTLPDVQFWETVAWNGTIFFALAASSISAATSADGITWTLRTLPSIQSWYSVATVGNTFCFAAYNAVSTSYKTTDGITFTSIPIGIASQGYIVTSDGVKFCGVPANAGTNVITSYLSYPLAGTYAVTFTGGGGTGASGIYTISPITGIITSVILTNSGSNYTTAPTLSFTFGGITGASGHVGMTWTYAYVPSGPTPMVSLKYSNDGGHTWSIDNWRDISLGTIGQYAKRVFWYRLGMTTGQVRLYELSSTAPVKISLLNTYLE